MANSAGDQEAKEPIYSYYDNAENNVQLRTVVYMDKIRSEQCIADIIQLWALPEITLFQAITPINNGGNDGEILKLFVDHKARAVKRYKSGTNAQLVRFHEALHSYVAANAELDPVAVLVLSVVRPVAWMSHLEKLCLVFQWFPHEKRSLTPEDMSSLRAQVDFCHSLGFCHLDITARNILLSDKAALLMDYDCVCRVDDCPLGPIPPESTERVKKRDAVRIVDDEALWNDLCSTTGVYPRGTKHVNSCCLKGKGFRPALIVA